MVLIVRTRTGRPGRRWDEGVVAVHIGAEGVRHNAGIEGPPRHPVGEVATTLWSCGEQENAKICLPLGITTKSDFVFAQPRPIAAVGGRAVVLCTHIGMAWRNSTMRVCHRKMKFDSTKAFTTRRALLLAFPVLYTSGLLPSDCPPELSNRHASRPVAEIPKILSSAVPSRFRADALADGQPSL
jgi:hypothetical protein